MQRRQRMRALWIALIGAVVLSGVVIPLWVTADSGEVGFTATLYSDVIRFEADGVGSLRLTIYDLSENELWSSGQVMGDFVDWDRANATGERLANGYYLYLAQGWDGSDTLVLNKTGKVVLLPGDQVQLKASPTTGGTDSASNGGPDWPGDPVLPGPRAHTPGTSTFDKVGVGTLTPGCTFDVNGIFRATNTTDSVTYIRTSGTNNSARIDIAAGNGTTSLRYAYFRFSSFEAVPHDWRCGMYGNKNFTIHDATNAATRFVIDTAGRVGIGTTSPGQELDVAGDISLSGYVYKGSNRLLHNYGTYSTFLGIAAGNLTLSGQGNTGIGRAALNGLTSGDANTAVGSWALPAHTTGNSNTAVGYFALKDNTAGHGNTAVGSCALRTLHGIADNHNTAIGISALDSLENGDYNIALGENAGEVLVYGDENIYIGHPGYGIEDRMIRIGNEASAYWTYIQGIHGTTVAGGTSVYVKSDGQLGTLTSSARFKTAISGVGQRSEILYELRPVSFRYREDIDPLGIPQYGLIAEEVAEVAPDLVITDENGAPYTVRYEQLVPLLVNELQAKDAEIQQMRSEVEELRELVESRL